MGEEDDEDGIGGRGHLLSKSALTKHNHCQIKGEFSPHYYSATLQMFISFMHYKCITIKDSLLPDFRGGKLKRMGFKINVIKGIVFDNALKN